MSLTEDVVSRRRSLLDSELRTHKQDRLMKKIPVDQQFLTVAREDLGLKRQFLEKMEASNEVYAKKCSA